MTSLSLLDFLNENSSPIWKAQTAVREDSIDQLRPLLVDPKNPVTQDTFVNSQTKENLLHFAVHQSAARCITLLVNRPFSWDPDRANLMGKSPLNLAEASCYLPVWYPLAAHSKKARLASDVNAHQSVATILTHPSDYLGREIANYDLFNIFGTTPIPGSLVEVEDKYANASPVQSARNLDLLLELLLATPGIQVGDDLKVLEHLCKAPSSGDTQTGHASDCSTYPLCLFEPIDMNLTNQYVAIVLDKWKFHRLMTTVEDEDEEEQEAAAVAEHKKDLSSLPPTPLFCPPSLQSWCRIQFRKFAVSILNSFKSPTTDQHPCLNYASFVCSLPIPSIIQAYLAYRELWPTLDRHLVSRRPRRLRTLTWQPLPFDMPEHHMIIGL